MPTKPNHICCLHTFRTKLHFPLAPLPLTPSTRLPLTAAGLSRHHPSTAPHSLMTALYSLMTVRLTRWFLVRLFRKSTRHRYRPWSCGFTAASRNAGRSRCVTKRTSRDCTAPAVRSAKSSPRPSKLATHRRSEVTAGVTAGATAGTEMGRLSLIGAPVRGRKRSM